MFSRTQATYVVLAILVLMGSLLPTHAQPELASPITSYTTPAYLGRSISANVSIQNLATMFARFRQVQLEFDWNQTFTGPLEILAPGESYNWKFPNCPIPEDTWLGNHTFVFSFSLSWAGAAGNWSLENRMSVPPTHFVVEAPQQPGPGSLESLDAFLSSAPGISAFFLTMTLVVVVALAIGAPWRRKAVERVSSLLLSAIGFVILWYFSGRLLQPWWVAPVVWLVESYMILIAALSIPLVRLHKEFWSKSFGRAVDAAKELSPGAIGLSCFMLNFTFCTLGFLLPFREALVTFIPPLQPAARLFPVSFTESAFLRTYGGSTLAIVLPGPAILFALRTMRQWNPRTGRTTLEILQVIFYASVIFAVYSWASGSALSGELLENYRTALVFFVLPGSLIAPLAICLLNVISSLRRE